MKSAEFLRKYWVWLVLIALSLGAIFYRLQAYGDLRLSIANNDSIGYVTASEAPLWSWQAFTGRRLFTTNVIYQLLKPPGGYEILVNGSGDTVRRRIQPSFIHVIRFQTLLSVASWGILAITIASRLKKAWLKISAASFILLFAFVPHLADWDSLLTSESLTFSLFALKVALFTLLAFRLARDPALDLGTGLLLAAWLITVFFWTFLRDTNLYAIPVDLMMVLGLLAFPAFRKQRYVLVAALLLAGMFLLGWVSSSQSIRSRLAVRNIYIILGHPAVVEFMQARGMPEPSTPAYEAWFDENARSMYLTFLIHHPGYVTGLIARDALLAFSESSQPYFNARDQPRRTGLNRFSEVIHPENPAPLFLDGILLAGVWAVALKRKDAASLSWAWVGTWMMLIASVNLSVVILADAYGLTRHALMATTVFRLFMWLYAFVLIDLSLLPEKESAPALQS
jgi:hypothetical protein